jgi:hypothetical protein
VVGATSDLPTWAILLTVGVLGTVFTLVVSNVGATVLLVPLAVNVAVGVGADPAMFGLMVAIAASNAFVLPTHQVNALLMGPGGYRVKDYVRAGSVMSVVFLLRRRGARSRTTAVAAGTRGPRASDRDRRHRRPLPDRQGADRAVRGQPAHRA